MLKTLLCSLCLLTSLCAQHTIIEDQCGLSIVTPSLAERAERKIRLDNGLEAYLISDPGAHQSGAAMAVGVGSWDDPMQRPGMAHFVEHLLFLGTEKYPEEGEYHAYLSEHGGTHNAFTAADRTVYMFAINPTGFEEALDRFAQFFVAPLFNPSGVGRECHAINQEFAKDVPLDPWRVLHVRKELGNPDHPFHHFDIGNHLTLGKISQDELKQWYRTHYSSHLMHLVVVSPLPIDQLETEVATLFSQVTNQKNTPTRWNVPLLSQDTAGKLCTITPVQDVQTLDLLWELPPDIVADKNTRVDNLLSYILGHEGEGSLLAELKKEQLAESLRAGGYQGGRDQGLFSLSIELTSKGVQNYSAVISRCFETLASLRQEGIPEYIFDEIQRKEKIAYRYQEREELFSYVTQLAYAMVDEPLETFPRKSLMPTTFDKEKAQMLLTKLTPHACHFSLIAPPNLTRMKNTRKETWMDVAYGLRTISEKQLAAWTASPPHQAISVPRPNRFLPNNLTLVKQTATPEPSLLADSDTGRVYVSGDQTFLVPEVSWSCTLKTPLISEGDPKSFVLADLYCHAVSERLATLAYEAEMGGLSYALAPSQQGIQLTIKGYHEKAPAFLEQIAQKMTSLEPTLEEFVLYKDMAKRAYANGATESPLAQGFELLWSVLYKNYATYGEKEAAATSLAFDDFALFAKTLWNEAYIEGMFYGNLSEAEAKQTWETLRTALSAKPYPRALHPKVMVATLPSKKDPVYLSQKSVLPGNALILTTDCGEFSFKRRAAQEILMKGLEEPFFSELRTRQQTGYLVSSGSKEIERHLYSFFLIQSSTHDPRDLLSRFELFLESHLQDLSVIPEERFVAIQAALITQLENPAEQLSKKGDLLHKLAFDYDGDFLWLDQRIAGLKELSYEEFKTYAIEFLGKENKQRLAVAIGGSLPPKDRFKYRALSSPKKLRKEIDYAGRKSVISLPMKPQDLK